MEAFGVKGTEQHVESSENGTLRNQRQLKMAGNGEPVIVRTIATIAFPRCVVSLSPPSHPSPFYRQGD